MAISDFMASFLNQAEPEQPQVPKTNIEATAPEGYRPLYFHCWLCKGVTKFAMKNSIKKKKFTMECSRCGIENSVTVN